MSAPTKTRFASKAIMNSPLFKRAILSVGLIIVFGLAVLTARFLRSTEPVEGFIEQYHGTTALPANAPVGIPAWLGWQHFLNMFLMLFIIRSGWQIRNSSLPMNWKRKKPGWFFFKKQGKKINLAIWWHLSWDMLWILNGIVFFVLIFATGQWMRLVPLSWDVLPNALSVVIQYLSLDWPLENGWVNYNSLQLITYFLTVFIAAPLAIMTGVRMSPAFQTRVPQANRFLPMSVTRQIHFIVMLWFVVFILVHVTLVLTTGALRNLNHMYASQDNNEWLGFMIFSASIFVLVGGWFAASPFTIRYLASFSGTVTR
jgi:thiosulfate reductase cytochrome b subunit